MAITYRHPQRHTVNYVKADKPQTQDEARYTPEGSYRLRKGESITLKAAR